MPRIGLFPVPDHAHSPIPGTAVWTNPVNNIRCVWVHYMSDPDKRSAAWKAMAQKGHTQATWNQEYEGSIDIWEGMPVYQSFDRDWHVAKEPLKWSRKRQMWCGWDVGRHACVWAQQFDRRLYVYAARQSIGAFGALKVNYGEQEYPVTGLSAFIQSAVEERESIFTGAEWRDVGDPSIANPTVTREETPEQIFRRNGVKLDMARSNDIAMRISAVEDWFTYAVRDRQLGRMVSGITIDASCTMLIDGMAGGYKFKQDGADAKPYKDGFSHTQDCLQYIALSLPLSPSGAWQEKEEKEVIPVNMEIRHMRQTLARIGSRRGEHESYGNSDWTQL